MFVCRQLYDWIKYTGNCEALHDFIEELKYRIHFQFVMLSGEFRALKLLIITREGKIHQPDTLCDFTGNGREIFEQMKKWLDLAVPVRIVSSLDESSLIPGLEGLMNAVGIEWKLTENRLYRALDFMVRHYTSNFKVKELADLVCYEENTCKKWFKEQTGKTIIEFRLDLRIEKAGYELEHSDKSISRIAVDLDFTDHASFTNFFREKTGRTPKDYRKNHQT